jgi:general nucleoside transport system permease protein
VLLSMFLIGGELAQSRIGLPSALSNVFQGVLLVALLACDTLIHYKIRSSQRSVYADQTAKMTPKAAPKQVIKT